MVHFFSFQISQEVTKHDQNAAKAGQKQNSKKKKNKGDKKQKKFVIFLCVYDLSNLESTREVYVFEDCLHYRS